MTDVVNRLWGFCHQLRHEGVDYGDYIEQVTYLLFLKMADEREVELPEKCDWPSLTQTSGSQLLDDYVDALRLLGKQPGVLGDIFAGAQSRFGNAVSLSKLMRLIDETDWTELEVDVKAAAFEGLLEKAASEGKKGAGQYFTPRPVIDTMVRCMKPDPFSSDAFSVGDPACGTGGFLTQAYEWFVDQTKGAVPRGVAKRVRSETYFGQDLVPRPRRLALMNLYLHGLEPQIGLGNSIYEPPGTQRFNVILTNPPFGTRGASEAPARDDFTVETSNKQLNFLQHISTVLKPGGRAAVVVPDNCLFADKAGNVFRNLTEDANLHTVLRLPNGTFTPYSPGTKTNVVFFTKGSPTEHIWVYDGRTNVPSITKKDRPLTPEHFVEFERCYGESPDGRSDRSESDSSGGRWRQFGITQIKDIDFKIDSLRWLADESFGLDEDLGNPAELARDIAAELDGAAELLRGVEAILAGTLVPGEPDA